MPVDCSEPTLAAEPLRSSRSAYRPAPAPLAPRGAQELAERNAIGELEAQKNEVIPLRTKKGLRTHREGSLAGSTVWKILGPGILVCLADTDAGGLIVAAQTGSKYKYSMLSLLLLLVPVLFLCQELTIRLGIYTRKGYIANIRQHFGRFWGGFICCLVCVVCCFAMVSEMSGVAAVAELWGLHRHAGTLVSACILIFTVVAFNYRQIEALGIAFGLCELSFVLTMFLYHPNAKDVFAGAVTIPLQGSFFLLIAANIGAVLMPWMIVFQQSAVVARRLVTYEDLAEERLHTLVGSFLTQLVAVGLLVTMAAARPDFKDLQTVHEIVDVLSEQLGYMARIFVSLGMLGGSLCASFVVSLAASWAVCEAYGSEETYSLDVSPAQAPLFYGIFTMVVGFSVVVLLSGVKIVSLNVYIEMINAVLLPFTITFLLLLASSQALPQEVRVTGAHKGILVAIFTICSVLSITSATLGMIA